jgi:6-phosphogluconolactonase (cycloisomerase 2 family)
VTVSPSGQFLYAVNQAASTVSGYAITPGSGALTPVPGSPFAAGNQPRNLTVDPSSRFVYVANLADNNITGYGIGSSTGSLSVLAGSPFATGRSPYFVAVANNAGSEFAYATNELDGTVSAFVVSPTTSALAPVAGSPFPSGAAPSSLGLSGAGNFAYVANFGGGTVSGYSIDPATGALTALAGSPVSAGFGPLWMSTPPALSVQIGGVSSGPSGHPAPIPPLNSNSGGLIPVIINQGNSKTVTVDPSTLTSHRDREESRFLHRAVQPESLSFRYAENWT